MHFYERKNAFIKGDYPWKCKANFTKTNSGTGSRYGVISVKDLWNTKF